MCEKNRTLPICKQDKVMKRILKENFDRQNVVACGVDIANEFCCFVAGSIDAKINIGIDKHDKR